MRKRSPPSADRKAKEAAARALWGDRPRVNLILVAHADDAEMRFGATMCHLADRGEKIFIVVASDGRLGCTDATVAVRDLVARRKTEQLAAARRAGVSGVFFLGLPDGELQTLKPKLKERFTYHIRKLRPDAVFTYDPTLFYFPQEAKEGFHRILGAISHPDHRAVGEAALDAVYCGSALTNYARTQALRPWVIDELFLAATAHPNVSVDSARYFERKKALLREYASQGVEDWLAAALGAEKAFRYIPCSPQAHERGLLSGKPERDAGFFAPL